MTKEMYEQFLKDIEELQGKFESKEFHDWFEGREEKSNDLQD